MFSGRSREGPKGLGPPFFGSKRKNAERRKACRARDTSQVPPASPPLAQGLDPPLMLNRSSENNMQQMSRSNIVIYSMKYLQKSQKFKL